MRVDVQQAVNGLWVASGEDPGDETAKGRSADAAFRQTRGHLPSVAVSNQKIRPLLTGLAEGLPQRIRDLSKLD